MENKRLIISVGAPIIGDNVESVNGKTGVVVLDGTDMINLLFSIFNYFKLTLYH